ncbi:MAG: FAD-binding protein [Bacteroidaceae bacterium]|nr:FAD-binding protein [Bacteroidaceae bacterium]
MIKDIQLRVQPQFAASDAAIRETVAREAALELRRICSCRVLKRSIDARQRQVMVNLTVRVFVDEEPQEEAFQRVEYPDVTGRPQVIVVGAGPGGLFAALRLIELGLRPIVLERGKDVHARKKDIALISREHRVNPESNYSFGEGGAGAYSDGKLYTRSKKRGSVEKILNVFCQHGASTAILSDAHPHIGTDRLPRVIENIRSTILRCGGEVHFQTLMTDLLMEGERVTGCVCRDLVATNGTEGAAVGSTAGTRELHGPVILATGHSARDVYRLLAARGIEIEAKGIAVGVRLEHPSHLIDQIQYHSRQGRGQWLPAAEYSFVQQVQGRGVYSFCMCPGGFVVPAATGPEQVVVNGMSPSSRGSRWSNSGMVVELRPEDIGPLDLGRLTLQERTARHSATLDTSRMDNPQLSMMLFQESLERLCWQQGGRRQTAPAQRMADFVNGRLSFDLPVSSYQPGLVSSPLHFWMPNAISSRLQEAFRLFGRRSHGFLTNEAVVIGVETRTSSPVRILRSDETFQHIRLSGLYPCGEGAGYAGGIVSAAIDGERCAEAAASNIK